MFAWSVLGCGFAQPADNRSGDAVWAASYDSANQTRYIPLEPILGAASSGKHEISMPQGNFTEGEARNPSTWRGPVEWRHPDTGEKIMVYERARRGVAQKFALRADGSAIGRVADTRFGISSCIEEAKYPLGYWKQGETRRFEYRCWYGAGDNKRLRGSISTLTIEQIDFEYGGAPHALQLRWILKHQADAREIDNRVYVFVPGRGIVSVH